jgi:hypothetical protein
MMNSVATFMYMHGLKYREARLHGSKVLPEALPKSSQIATVHCNGDGRSRYE